MVPEVLNTPEMAIECAISNPRIVNVSEMFAQPSIQVKLPPAALSKLRQLSLISLAASSTSNRQLPYAEVMQL
ncbi:hypothetical protein TELCIR_19520 [Teladorsagia circumcincta]|uniref:Uncharacterized protein n=1 Tax=Teladorsagia circumcincta TaxID=45464 RepID=A0A2G9TLZ9_TELCI|nr:hypothetical protein TELCIR_19520 [Teladorsagia circumcincta]